MCGRITLLNLEELEHVVQYVEQSLRSNASIDLDGKPQAAFPPAESTGSHHANSVTPNRANSTMPDQASFVTPDRANDGAPRLHAFPGSKVPAIALQDETINLTYPLWGVDVSWNKRLVFNTRIESALGKDGMWKDAIREGRCILPAATFFEPHATETVPSPKTGKPIKRPYEFAMPDAQPLLLASVRLGDRLSVVTTEPNEHVAPVHPRMPLVLRFEEVETWLDGGLADIAPFANRADVRLTCAPEYVPARQGPPEDDSQLSLF